MLGLYHEQNQIIVNYAICSVQFPRCRNSTRDCFCERIALLVNELVSTRETFLFYFIWKWREYHTKVRLPYSFVKSVYFSLYIKFYWIFVVVELLSIILDYRDDRSSRFFKIWKKNVKIIRSESLSWMCIWAWICFLGVFAKTAPQISKI